MIDQTLGSISLRVTPATGEGRERREEWVEMAGMRSGLGVDCRGGICYLRNSLIRGAPVCFAKLVIA